MSLGFRESMRHALVLILSCSLLGCGAGSSNGSSVEGPDDGLTFQSLDLTGTWLVTNETRRTRIDTGEYISSSFSRYRYVLDDGENGVRQDECWKYGDVYSGFGVKTDENFYMNPGDAGDAGFKIVDNNTLVRVSEYESEWEPGFSLKSISTLKRISDGVSVDSGTFVLNGPISLTEYSHVCVFRNESSLGEVVSLQVLMPYEDSQISLNLRLVGAVPPGTYYYNRYWESEEIDLDINSNARSFWEIVGSNTLAAEDVTVNVIESSEEKISGTFDFLGQDEERYSGEFEVFYDR